MKYFYTDPLAAAWMAKHFGMKFEIEYDTLYFGEGDHKGKRINVNPLMTLKFNKDAFDSKTLEWVISTDSLHLLEPQVGDLWIATAPDTESEFWYLSHKMMQAEILREMPSNFVCIQRNGIPFMWPAGEKMMAEGGQ